MIDSLLEEVLNRLRRHIFDDLGVLAPASPLVVLLLPIAPPRVSSISSGDLSRCCRRGCCRDGRHLASEPLVHDDESRGRGAEPGPRAGAAAGQMD